MLAGPSTLAQTLDQIIASLNPGYDPMRQSIQTQQSALPAQFDAQQQGLQAQANQAHQDILSGAQNRGLGFSGIPVGEQAKYDATSFMPAVANLKSNMINAQTSLADQLNKVNLDQNTQAQGILQTQQARDEQQRQFDANMAWEKQKFDMQQRAAAAQAAQAASYFNSANSAPSGPSGNPFGGTPAYTQRADKGFSFTDANGSPINAVQYSKAMGVPFRDLLQTMANGGDQGARTALGFVGNDYGYDPGKVTNNQGYINLLHALGINASAYTPAQQNKSPVFGANLVTNSYGAFGAKRPF